VHLSLYGRIATSGVFKDPDRFDIFRDDLHFGRELRSGYHQDAGRATSASVRRHFCVGLSARAGGVGDPHRMLMQGIRNPRLKAGLDPSRSPSGSSLGTCR